MSYLNVHIRGAKLRLAAQTEALDKRKKNLDAYEKELDARAEELKKNEKPQLHWTEKWGAYLDMVRAEKVNDYIEDSIDYSAYRDVINGSPASPSYMSPAPPPPSPPSSPPSSPPPSSPSYMSPAYSPSDVLEKSPPLIPPKPEPVGNKIKLIVKPLKPLKRPLPHVDDEYVEDDSSELLDGPPPKKKLSLNMPNVHPRHGLAIKFYENLVLKYPNNLGMDVVWLVANHFDCQPRTVINRYKVVKTRLAAKGKLN